MNNTIEFKPSEVKLIIDLHDDQTDKSTYIIPFCTDPPEYKGVLSTLKGDAGEPISVSYTDVKEIYTYLTVYFKCKSEDNVIVIPINSEALECVMRTIGATNPTQCLISYCYACFVNKAQETLPAVSERKDFILPVLSGYAEADENEVILLPAGAASNYISFLIGRQAATMPLVNGQISRESVNTLLIPAVIPLSLIPRTQILKTASEIWKRTAEGVPTKAPPECVGRYIPFGIVLSISIDFSKAVLFASFTEFYNAVVNIPRIDVKNDAKELIAAYCDNKFYVCGNFMSYESAERAIEDAMHELQLDVRNVY